MSAALKIGEDHRTRINRAFNPRPRSHNLPRDGQQSSRDVLVVDANKQFVEYVSRAVARKYISTRAVKVLKRGPQMVLQLPHGVDRVRVYFDKSDQQAKASRYRKRNR